MGEACRVRALIVRIGLLCAGLFVAVCLNGCETEYERQLRLSCHWNEDIKLVNCDRIDFASCIQNCEYCLGKQGTQFEGKSDECNQLKCGAFCANAQSGDCVKTYNTLCTNAKEELSNAGITCDAMCNAATRKAPGSLFLLGLAAVFFNLGMPSVRMRYVLLAFVACVVMSSLQGCAYDFCIHKATPTLNWNVDYKELDRLAGCDNKWNLNTGNPCASDVPVLWAKKGITIQDEDYIKEQVENENYQCIEWYNSSGTNVYCHRWVAKESSCDEEDFGVCTCLVSSANNMYCQSWSCFMKEADQHECWTSCCGSESCTPCVMCGQHGSSPFHMDYGVFLDLLQASGAGTLMSLNDEEATRLLRNIHYNKYNLGGACIVSRHITDYTQAPIGCGSWREVETEMSFCSCETPEPDGHYCLNWRCEEKDVGQFSILFAKPMSYAGLIEGQEVEAYNCLEYSVADGNSRCAKWKGDINSFEEVEQTLCLSCGNGQSFGDQTDQCDTWICNEYELPRVHDVDEWPKRFFFSFVHLCWMLPILLILCMPPPFDKNSSGEDTTMGICIYVTGSLCGTLFVAWLIWSIAFLRYLSDEARWQHPRDPFLGLFLPMLLGVPVAFVLSICTPIPVPTGAVQVPTIMLTGLFFTVGIWVGAPAAAGFFVLIIGLLYCFCEAQS